jgi:hypothetical protein
VVVVLAFGGNEAVGAGDHVVTGAVVTGAVVTAADVGGAVVVGSAVVGGTVVPDVGGAGG